MRVWKKFAILRVSIKKSKKIKTTLEFYETSQVLAKHCLGYGKAKFLPLSHA